MKPCRYTWALGSVEQKKKSNTLPANHCASALVPFHQHGEHKQHPGRRTATQRRVKSMEQKSGGSVCGLGSALENLCIGPQGAKPNPNEATKPNIRILMALAYDSLRENTEWERWETESSTYLAPTDGPMEFLQCMDNQVRDRKQTLFMCSCQAA